MESLCDLFLQSRFEVFCLRFNFIKRDFLKHKTVKTNDKIRRFGVVMTPLSNTVYERLFSRALKPNLNVQSDSIRAKVFL